MEQLTRDFLPISDEEARIVRLMARGHTPAEIARQLNVGVDSVEQRVRQLAERIRGKRPAQERLRRDVRRAP